MSYRVFGSKHHAELLDFGAALNQPLTLPRWAPAGSSPPQGIR